MIGIGRGREEKVPFWLWPYKCCLFRQDDTVPSAFYLARFFANFCSYSCFSRESLWKQSVYTHTHVCVRMLHVCTYVHHLNRSRHVRIRGKFDCALAFTTDRVRGGGGCSGESFLLPGGGDDEAKVPLSSLVCVLAWVRADGLRVCMIIHPNPRGGRTTVVHLLFGRRDCCSPRKCF